MGHGRQLILVTKIAMAAAVLIAIILGTVMAVPLQTDQADDGSGGKSAGDY